MVKRTKTATKAKEKPQANSGAATIQLPKREMVTITVIGDTPYVGTNFSDVTKKELVAEQSGKNKTKARPARDVEGEVYGRRHIVDGIDCIPSEAFRAAIIDTAKDDILKEVNGEAVRRSVSVQGDMGNHISILNGKGELHEGPTIFESVVKLANGARHVAYRPSYDPWSTTFTIIYLADRFTQQDILNLLARAGVTTGVGDTRRIGGGRFYLAGKDQI